MSLLAFTANPLAEITFDLAAPARLQTTQRARAESFQVGGKGFNVAKMAHRLGLEVSALSFAGGLAGAACRDWLRAHAAYPWTLLPTAVPTRTGLVVRDPSGAESTFLGPDTRLDAGAVQAAADLLGTLPASVTVALCGSFPGWSDSITAPLRTVFQQLAATGRLVIDTYGPVLTELVQHPAALVKINRVEWTALVSALELPPTLAAACSRLPVQRWIVTDGPGRVEYWTEAGTASFLPDPIEECSATGSGDVFLGTMLAGAWSDNEAFPALVRRAARFASLNAAHPAIAEFNFPV